MRGKAVCVLMIGLGLTLSACAPAPGGMEQKDGAQMLQEEYRALTGCAMTADVRCDRENEVENYTLQCDWNADGSARVEVLAPETLVGIAAEFNGDDLSLHYDDMSLAAGPVSSQELTPAQILPMVVDAIREGYILEKGTESIDGEECLCLVFDTAGQDDGKIDYTVWFASNHLPLRAEVQTEGKTVFTVTFSEFSAAEGTADGSV